MKYLFTLVLISGFACMGAKAQTIASNPADLFKQKPLTSMDSLAWHMPKTPNTLKQFLSARPLTLGLRDGKLDTMNDIVWAGAADITSVNKVYSTMPVIHPGGSYKMPVAKVASVGDKLNKQLIVINPLAEYLNLNLFSFGADSLLNAYL